jgi:predicted molibdopterin-dependent oxidoreductase YjgC
MSDDRPDGLTEARGASLRVEDDDPRGLTRGPALTLTFDGMSVAAYEGESVGAALLAADVRALRRTRHGDAPRGLFCGIGSCHDCLVRIDGAAPVRACLTPVRDGMAVTTHVLGEGDPS